MYQATNRTSFRRSLQAILFAIVTFVSLSAEVCLKGGCGTTTIVDMENGVLVGKIFCKGKKPDEERTNYDDICVGVTKHSGLRIECGKDDVLECPGGCS